MIKDFSFKINGIIFVLLILCLAAPSFQGKFKLIEISPLNGAVVAAQDPDLSVDGWLSGDYQAEKEKYINDFFGFRPFMVRLNNQIAFSLFNKANANKVVIGKQNYLYEENYIKAFYGEDYLGKNKINELIRKMKFIQDNLSNQNKTFILLLAAGKASYYPEYIPVRDGDTNNTNYKLLAEKAKKNGINVIDFNEYFIRNKRTSQYPLYPKYGIHWSNYASQLVSDSIIRYIERNRNIDMPDIIWDSIVMDYPRKDDYDIGGGMNILFKLESDEMAYPYVSTKTEKHHQKPSILGIGDSFYWSIYNKTYNLFTTSHFWFYNKQVFPETYTKELDPAQLDMGKEIKKHDIIIICATEATLSKLGWGFIEKADSYFVKK